jgi:hypothetical protein
MLPWGSKIQVTCLASLSCHPYTTDHPVSLTPKSSLTLATSHPISPPTPHVKVQASAPFTLPLHHPPPRTATCLTCALRLRAQPLAMDPLPRSSGPPRPFQATMGFAGPFPCYCYPSCALCLTLPPTGLCPHVFIYIFPPLVT